MTTPEDPLPGRPCEPHRKLGFIYSVIGCPRCYPALAAPPVAGPLPEPDFDGFHTPVANRTAPPVEVGEATDHNHPFDSLCLVSECPLGAWRAALRSAAPPVAGAEWSDAIRERLARVDWRTADGLSVIVPIWAAEAALRSTAPALDEPCPNCGFMPEYAALEGASGE